MKKKRSLASCIQEFWPATILTPIFVIGEVAFDVLIPLMTGKLLDEGVKAGSMHHIAAYGLTVVGMAVLALICGGLSGRFGAKASTGFARNLRREMYRNVQKFSFANIDKFSTSGIITRLTTDVTNVQMAFMMVIRIAVRSPIMLICAWVLTLRINPKLALIFLVVIPILGIGLALIMTRAHPIFERVFKRYDHLNNVVQEGLTAIRAVKAFVRGEYEEEKFQGVNSELMETSQRTFRLAVLNLPVFQLVMYTAVVLIMWLGEQITEKGIGNGISLIIFSGIVVGIPGALVKSFQLIKLGDMSLFIALALVILMVAVLVGVVFMERAQRRIPIQYAKRQVGRKMYGGQSTHLPLRVNTAGVIPPIFASSLLLFPATMANFDIADWLKTAASWFTPSSILYNVIFIALIFFFCFFYTAIIFDPKDVAENLKKAGGFIPGIRPGEKTQEYLDAVLSRLTLWGGVYISVISVLPMLLIAEFNVPFYFGGTSILILVGVAMDFMSQIESHLISRQYEGLMGKTRMKGRS